MAIKHFLWDVTSDDVLAELDESQAATTIYTNGPSRFDGAISQESGNETSYLHYDGTQSVGEYTDEESGLIGTRRFTAFGEVVEATGSIETAFWYKGGLGYYTEADGNRMYARDRYYSPEIGRWFSAGANSVSRGIGSYFFAQNNPLIRASAIGHAVVGQRGGRFPIACLTWTFADLDILREAEGDIEIPGACQFIWRRPTGGMTIVRNPVVALCRVLCVCDDGTRPSFEHWLYQQAGPDTPDEVPWSTETWDQFIPYSFGPSDVRDRAIEQCDEIGVYWENEPICGDGDHPELDPEPPPDPNVTIPRSNDGLIPTNDDIKVALCLTGARRFVSFCMWAKRVLGSKGSRPPRPTPRPPVPPSRPKIPPPPTRPRRPRERTIPFPVGHG